MLENGVFLLMGAQLSRIVTDVHVDELSADKAVYLGLLMAAILIVLRFGFVWPLLAVVRRREAREEKRVSRLTLVLERVQDAAMGGVELGRRALGRVVDGETPRAVRSRRLHERRRAGFERQVVRRQNDVTQLKAEGLDWRGAIVLGWAGMRGVVTLAAAQSLPRETPYREQLILIAFTVAVTTLLVQGGTLPLVIRWVRIQGADRASDRRELAELLDEMSAAGIEALDNPSFELPDGESVQPDILERVRTDTLLATQTAWERAEHADDEDGILSSPASAVPRAASGGARGGAGCAAGCPFARRVPVADPRAGAEPARPRGVAPRSAGERRPHRVTVASSGARKARIS